jgi:general secretion pathway protein A
MIILCGQQELATRIERFPEIKSRMYPSALSALSRDETEELIKYRWQTASAAADNPLPFQRQAVDQVFAYSRGLPREICKLCDMALLAAFADERRTIDSQIIGTVAASLDLEEGPNVN